ncbi:MAG: hypothetical protein ACLFTK_09735, partial [Anaerolineales bacterium]
EFGEGLGRGNYFSGKALEPGLPGVAFGLSRLYQDFMPEMKWMKENLRMYNVSLIIAGYYFPHFGSYVACSKFAHIVNRRK